MRWFLNVNAIRNAFADILESTRPKRQLFCVSPKSHEERETDCFTKAISKILQRIHFLIKTRKIIRQREKCFENLHSEGLKYLELKTFGVPQKNIFGVCSHECYHLPKVVPKCQKSEFLHVFFSPLCSGKQLSLVYPLVPKNSIAH